MIFVQMKDGLPVKVATELTEADYGARGLWESRWDWKDFETVQKIASYLTAMTGNVYLPVDATAAVFPRFDIIEAPKVGDEVSYGFNGDFYPDGTIVKITKTFQITTSTDTTYRRRGNRACWMKPGGTWGLVAGHIYEQNPHF
jgi:hypothetical protein